MKNLEELKFTKCVNLTSGPTAKGLEHILCLKHVYLSEMHPDFVNSVKTNKPKDAQILEINMHLHKSSKPTTEGSQAPIDAVEQSKEIDLLVDEVRNSLARFREEPVVIQKPYCVESYPNAVQNQPQIADRSTSNIDASGVETLHMNEIETSVCYKDNVCHLNHLTECEIEQLIHQKVATNTTLSNEERTPEGRQTTAPELVFPPRTEGEGDQTNPPRDAKGTTQNTKTCDSDDGDKAGQTSSMIETRQNSEQAKEQQTKDQSSDVGALIPRLQESELHDDDSAAKNASTAGPIQSSGSRPSTSQESSSRPTRRDDMDIQ